MDRICPLMSTATMPARCQREGCELFIGSVGECCVFYLAKMLDQITHK